MGRVSLIALVLFARATFAGELAPPPPLPDGGPAPQTAPAPSAAADDGIQPLDPAVGLASAAGCVGGGVAGPLLSLAFLVPSLAYVNENPGALSELTTSAQCASLLTVVACAGFGIASMAPCSALGATLAGTGAALRKEREPWRPLLGGAPGVLCALAAPLACLCFPIPGGSLITIAGLALGCLGGPCAVTGGAALDAQLVERAARLFEDDAGGARADAADEMHY